MNAILTHNDAANDAVNDTVNDAVILEPTYDRNIIFHFNKAYLTDPTIPMWTIKSKGETYYIDHLDSKIGFSTKETPDNPRTKGSLKFKGILSIKKINGQTIATIE